MSATECLGRSSYCYCVADACSGPLVMSWHFYEKYGLDQDLPSDFGNLVSFSCIPRANSTACCPFGAHAQLQHLLMAGMNTQSPPPTPPPLPCTLPTLSLPSSFCCPRHCHYPCAPGVCPSPAPLPPQNAAAKNEQATGLLRCH